jgi:hypothetical protein
MDEQKIAAQNESADPEADIEDLDVGASEADQIAGGFLKSGDPEDGGN